MRPMMNSAKPILNAVIGLLRPDLAGNGGKTVDYVFAIPTERNPPIAGSTGRFC